MMPLGHAAMMKESQAADNGLMGDLLATVMPGGEAHGSLCLYALVEKD